MCRCVSWPPTSPPRPTAGRGTTAPRPPDAEVVRAGERLPPRRRRARDAGGHSGRGGIPRVPAKRLGDARRLVGGGRARAADGTGPVPSRASKRTLLRAEEAWCAGIEGDKVRDELRRRVEALEKERARTAAPAVERAESLALREAKGATPPSADFEANRRRLRKMALRLRESRRRAEAG